MEICLCKGRKHCGNVFKSLLSQGCLKSGFFGKGLTDFDIDSLLLHFNVDVLS